MELPLGREDARRDARLRVDTGRLERSRVAGRACFFAVLGSAVAVDDAGVVFTADWTGPATYIASADSVDYFAIDWGAGGQLPELFAGACAVDIRHIACDLDARQSGLATAAVALFAWHARALYCETCGQALAPTSSGWERVCGSGHVVFPRHDPAVIMAIVDDADRLLLARHPQWENSRYSTLAGFVEAGETLEAAVRRETWEETGVRVDAVDYVGSQPWPFPRSLMLAFRGRATGDQNVQVDGEEIEDAFFITREDFVTRVREGSILPPGRASVAWALIRDWLEPYAQLGDIAS